MTPNVTRRKNPKVRISQTRNFQSAPKFFLSMRIPCGTLIGGRHSSKGTKTLPISRTRNTLIKSSVLAPKLLVSSLTTKDLNYLFPLRNKFNREIYFFLTIKLLLPIVKGRGLAHLRRIVTSLCHHLFLDYQLTIFSYFKGAI